MARFVQLYNIGDGVVPSNANTGGGSGDPVNVLAPGAGTTLTARTAASAKGSGQGLRVVGIAGETGSNYWTKPASPDFEVLYYKYADSARRPDATHCLTRVRSAAANVCKLSENVSGVFQLQNAAGTGFGGNANFNGNAAPANGWYAWQIYGTRGSTTANGVITAKMWNVATGLQVGATFTSSAANLGTADVTQLYWGKPEGAANVNADMDIPHFDTGSATAIPLWTPPANFPPTVALSAPDLEIFPGETVLITATASDPDGTIASYSWATDLGSLSGSGSTRTLFAPARSSDAAATVDVEVTDDDAATADATLQVTLKASGHRLCTSTGVTDPAIHKLFI